MVVGSQGLKESRTLTDSMYNWQTDIAPRLGRLVEVNEGFSTAKRGILEMPDGVSIFVKLATDASSHKWIQKEVEVYKVLQRQRYQYSPQLLSYSNDMSAFALEYLDGYIFDKKWTIGMLTEVMMARKELAKLKSFFENNLDYSINSVIDSRNHWAILSDNLKLLATLNDALLYINQNKIQISPESVAQFAAEMASWSPSTSSLVHMDIRLDNFGFNTKNGTGKLIDWNWLCVGDEKLDVASLFISIEMKSNLKPYELYPTYYSRQSLLYLAGYWIYQLAVTAGDNTVISPLRKHQANSAVTALTMLNYDQGTING